MGSLAAALIGLGGLVAAVGGVLMVLGAVASYRAPEPQEGYVWVAGPALAAPGALSVLLAPPWLASAGGGRPLPPDATLRLAWGVEHHGRTPAAAVARRRALHARHSRPRG